MPFHIIPHSFWGSSRMPSLLDEEEGFSDFMSTSGLTVSEDEKKIYVEAAVPGVDPDKIDVTYDKGTLWIRGGQEQAEEDKNKKFYRKASSAFSYRVAVPGEVDEKVDPEAICKNGIMKVIFSKRLEVQPKKLSVKAE